MKRLDVILTERGLVKSREAGKTLIKDGFVTVNGEVCTKPSAEFCDEDEIIVTAKNDFVGRGALKLQKAIDEFKISLDGAVCLDIGASTGGFTDCMLKCGASKVYALDVGHGQLDERLVNDSRVVNMEGTNIRTLPADTFKEKINFICIDVSFVSLKQVFPKALEVLGESGELVALIKPQFEAGRENLNKNGIVKSPKIHKAVLGEITAFCSEKAGVRGLTYSPVARKDGNIEYLIFLRAGEDSLVFDTAEVVSAAFSNVKFDR